MGEGRRPAKATVFSVAHAEQSTRVGAVVAQAADQSDTRMDTVTDIAHEKARRALAAGLVDAGRTNLEPIFEADRVLSAGIADVLGELLEARV